MYWLIFAATNVILCFFITSYVCFYAGLHRIKNKQDSDINFPDTPQYKPFKEELIERIKFNKGRPFKEIKIISWDKKPFTLDFMRQKTKKLH